MIENSEYISDPNIAADMVVVRNICSFDTNSAGGTSTSEEEMMGDPTPSP
jgi:hypothetical protein